MRRFISRMLERAASAALVWALSALAPGAARAGDAAGEDSARGLERAFEAAYKLYNGGNYAEACDAFKAILLDPEFPSDPVQSSAAQQALDRVKEALHRLGRSRELDPLFDEIAEIHAAHPWMLHALGVSMSGGGCKYGYIVAGEFQRGGDWRPDGRPVSTFLRDRVRALQWFRRAMALLGDAPASENNAFRLREFYQNFAQAVVNFPSPNASWRLTALTDLDTLPDYGDDYPQDLALGAPADAAGQPIFHAVPASWEAAKTDGERWRWLLARAEQAQPAYGPSFRLDYARFLRQQFDVHTMAEYGLGRGRSNDADPGADSGPFAVRTLKDNETIARLATGVKRFTLPPDADFIRIFREANEKDAARSVALGDLLDVYRDRQQYPRAAALLRDYLKDKRGDQRFYPRQLDAIVQPAGRFDPVATLPAGTAPELNLVFRNALQAKIAVYRLNEKRLLDDVRAYLKHSPREINGQRLQLDNLGWRVVEKNELRYRSELVREWTLPLEPAADHLSRRVPVAMPFDGAGVYLVTATFPHLPRAQGGSGLDKTPGTARLVVWLADLAVVQKPIAGGQYYYVGDARTGAPMPGAQLDFFGWRMNHSQNRARVLTHEAARVADADGGVVADAEVQPDYHAWQWIVTATTPDGRLAWLGDTRFWFSPPRGDDYDRQYNQTRAYTVTDRPVYRPGHTVEWKTWVGHNQYDRDTGSPFAGIPVTVEISNPRGETLYTHSANADAYGGVDHHFALPGDAALGVYQIRVKAEGRSQAIQEVGYANFRVEEYKKPEFSVTVGLPKDPVALGDAVKIPVSAKYYFGAPVAQAKATYKITREEYAAPWYPPWIYDWFFGPGYWWFGYDYAWWPGWERWGCRRPTALRAAAPRWGGSPPELAARGEAVLDAEGNFELSLDTATAKAMHGDLDHKYTVTVEVADASRRVIVGAGHVLAARDPFKVYAWTERGFWRAADVRAGDPLKIHFRAQSLDGKGVKGSGRATVFRVRYDEKGAPAEEEVHAEELATDDDGRAVLSLNAAQAGQYRVAFACRDARGNERVGATVLTVRGPAADTAGWRFANLELTPDKQDYQPGDTVRLMVNADKPDATVLYFLRPANGVGADRPKLLRLEGKSKELEIPVIGRDMPNFFVEAVTIADGKVYSETRAFAVPPARRFLNVSVAPEKDAYKPGGEAKFTIAVADGDGLPYRGQCAVALYDQSVDYIAGPQAIPGIRDYFWKWKREHQPTMMDSLRRAGMPVAGSKDRRMPPLGVFGGLEAEQENMNDYDDGFAEKALRIRLYERSQSAFYSAFSGSLERPAAAYGESAPFPGAARGFADSPLDFRVDAVAGDVSTALSMDAPSDGEGLANAAMRENFADTAYWAGAVETDEQGKAVITVNLPENLTAWRARVWTLAQGNRVGEGEATLVTRKDFVLRLQSPRFLTQGDMATLSAVVHNYLPDAQETTVALSLEGGVLVPFSDEVQGERALLEKPPVRKIAIPAGGEARVDWIVKAAHPGEAVVAMTAQCAADADAMKMRFPVHVHGAPRFVPVSGVLRDGVASAAIPVDVPKERLPDRSVLTVQYSPSVALAAIEALPYLFQQPHETADIELHRFVPAAVARKLLADLGLNLETIHKNRVNLNAAELGDPARRAAQWGEREHSTSAPWAKERASVDSVFDGAEMTRVVDRALAKLAGQQRSDGGWNWMPGYGGEASAHVTAVVVDGLQRARAAGVAVPGGMVENGRRWLSRYQSRQIAELKKHERTLAAYNAWAKRNVQGNAPRVEGKPNPDPLDALVWFVLAEGEKPEAYMAGRLFDFRNELPVYCKALMGLVFHGDGEAERLAMVRQNLEQFFVRDDENQTGFLKLPENSWWWRWHGAELEANTWYLRLLARVDPKGEDASRLAKYLVNNRRHRSAWESPRTTAYAIEALLEFARAAAESAPRQTVTVLYDGAEVMRREITPENLFVADNRFMLAGLAVEEGGHKIAIRREGTGPVYYNAYLEYFSLEDPIPAAGLDLKVAREAYRLVEDDRAIDVATAAGQAGRQRVERYRRQRIPDPFAQRADGRLALAERVESGDLLEIELTVEAKNDYEYIILEDGRAAGVEPVDLRSGYTGNEMGAYVEYRDEKTVFYITRLARGRHSLSYRVRAEIPGESYSALPARASALHAPELRANSNEMKLVIRD